MQTTRPAMMRGVNNTGQASRPVFYQQSQVIGEVRKRKLMGHMMGFYFYSRGDGTPLKTYR